MKHTFSLILFVITLLIIAWVLVQFIPGQGQAAVTTFEECAAAGNPVMESYPRQCMADGVVFIEQIPQQQYTGRCLVAGCSHELCIDESEVGNGGGISICIFKPEYACYERATCERQSSGTCGWTITPTIEQCLANATAGQE